MVLPKYKCWKEKKRIMLISEIMYIRKVMYSHDNDKSMITYLIEINVTGHKCLV